MGFEDLAWLFAPGGENSEISVTEAAFLWKLVVRTEGPVLELGRRQGATTAVIAAAAAGRPCLSVGTETALDGDVEEFLKATGLRLDLELRRPESFDPSERAFRLIVLHAGGGYLEQLGRVLSLWESLDGTGETAPVLVVLLESSDGPPSQATRTGWNTLARRLVDNGAADHFLTEGRLSALRKLGDVAPDLRLSAANAWREARRFQEAERAYQGLIQQDDSNAEAWHEYGRCLISAERYAEAETVLRKATELRDSHHYCNNLALALLRLGRADEAIPYLKQSLSLSPSYVHALNNLGWAYEETGQLRASAEVHRRAITVDPEYPFAHYNLGRTLLALGDLEEGWQEYEWRWRIAGFPSRRREFPCPQWDGSAVAGKALALWGEQGIGDQMAFGSMIRDLAEQGATGVIECAAKLAPLFRRSFPQFEIHASASRDGAEWIKGPFDFHAPFASLGKYLRNEIGKFPRRCGYLQSDPSAVAHWRQRLCELDDHLKIGLAWRSRNMSGSRRQQYLSIEELGPLLQVPGCTFICVQYGDIWAEIEFARREFGVEIVKFDDLDLFDDVDSLLAMTQSLDIGVASKFSSCLDMMAINDVPVLTFSRGITERNLGATGIPWYPSARCFTCAIGADPSATVQQMANALQEFVEIERNGSRIPTGQPALKE